MSYPRFRRARAHKMIRRATGTAIVLNSTAIAEVAAGTNGPGTGGFDLTLEAQVGDVIEYGINGILGNQNVIVGMDVYTMVAGSRVNPFGSGLSASLASTLGVSGWYSVITTSNWLVNGVIPYTLQSGDISAGTVTLRLHYATATAANRNLLTDSGSGLNIWAKNLGPVSV